MDVLTSGLPAIDWAGRDVERPSYRYKLHESKRRKVLLDTEGHRQRVWAFNDKLAGLRLAADLGVATPTAIADVATLDELDWDSLPDRFVLKPLNGAANRATFLLHRDGDGFQDLMDGGYKSRDDVVRDALDLVDRGLVSARFCVEELLAPRVDLRIERQRELEPLPGRNRRGLRDHDPALLDRLRPSPEGREDLDAGLQRLRV
ncbi:MAG: hypothetical protein ACO307_13715, partial [Ilumatobacteraceae bacterium]